MLSESMHGAIGSQTRKDHGLYTLRGGGGGEEEEEDDEGEDGRERTPRGVGMISKMTDLLLLVVFPCL